MAGRRDGGDALKPVAMLAILACATAVVAHAQGAVAAAAGAVVTVSIAPDTVTVGEPFTVRIRVRAPKSATIHFPAVPDTADAIEAVDPRAVEAADDEELLDRTALYRFAAWDIGVHTPHLANVVVNAGGADQSIAVAIPAVTVRSLLPADTSLRHPKEARAPVAPPSGWWRYVLLAAVLLAGIAVYLIVGRRRRRRAAAPARDPEPFAAALEAFSAIDAMGLAAAGEAGSQVIASVDVVRTYLARRFPELRESLTAPELERSLAKSDLPILPERLTGLLDRESSIRFARAGVAPAEAEALSRDAQGIVRDIQSAYEARLRALQRSPQRGRRR